MCFDPGVCVEITWEKSGRMKQWGMQIWQNEGNWGVEKDKSREVVRWQLVPIH